MNGKTATLRIIDNAAQARKLYGDQADYVAGRNLPEHEYRFELVITGDDTRAEVSLHDGATAPHVVAYLEQDGATLVDPGELIGPLTAAEWCSLRLGTDDDPLQCCADTSEVRDAAFHVLRMGGEQDQGTALRGVWRIVEEHGDLGQHPVVRKLFEYYVEGQPPVSSDAELAAFLAPNPDFAKMLIKSAPGAWDLTDPDERVRALGRLAGKIYTVVDPAVRAEYIAEIARMLDMPVPHVRLVFDAFRGNSGLPIGSQEQETASA